MNKQIADLEKRVNTKLETLVKTTNDAIKGVSDATKSVSDDLASLRKDYVAMIKVANEDLNKLQSAVHDHAKRINELEKKCN